MVEIQEPSAYVLSIGLENVVVSFSLDSILIIFKVLVLKMYIIYTQLWDKANAVWKKPDTEEQYCMILFI